MLHRVIFFDRFLWSFFYFTLRMDHVYIAMFVLIESMKVLQRVASCDIFGGAAYNVYFHWSCSTLWTQLFARTCLMNTESIETHILTTLYSSKSCIKMKKCIEIYLLSFSADHTFLGVGTIWYFCFVSRSEGLYWHTCSFGMHCLLLNIYEVFN